MTKDTPTPAVDTSREAVEPRCEAGCTSFYGGEKRHRKDCAFYPESFTEMYDDACAERDALRDQLAAARNEALEAAAQCCKPHEDDDGLDRQAKRECEEAILALKSTTPAPREVTVQESAWYACPNDDTALNYLESVYGNDLRCAVSCMLDALRALANEEQSDG